MKTANVHLCCTAFWLQVKIGDFGLSKIADSPEPMFLDLERVHKPMTSDHKMMGTVWNNDRWIGSSLHFNIHVDIFQ